MNNYEQNGGAHKATKITHVLSKYHGFINTTDPGIIKKTVRNFLAV